MNRLSICERQLTATLSPAIPWLMRCLGRCLGRCALRVEASHRHIDAVRATNLLFALLLLTFLLVGCAAQKYTIDDGRKVDEALLSNIKDFGAGENTIRAAIVRSATLNDPQCSTQWELPVAVSSSYDWREDDRVAWVRGLGVDERLTVVGAAPGSPLKLRDKIVEVGGFTNENTEKMLLALVDLRDHGMPFDVKLSTGEKRRITPVKVCRGYTRLAAPNTPKAQDYHWLLSVHPLEVAKANLSEDEALWLVLWTQAVSEEAGARMKTYHYGTKIAGAVYNLFTIATGLKGAAVAASAIVETAKTAAASAATNLLKQQIIDQATALAASRLKDQVLDATHKLALSKAVDGMQQAAVNRGTLSGVSWVASTKFLEADVWAFERMAKLNANPLSGLTLNQKLLERQLMSNSMALDPERMAALVKLAEGKGLRDEVAKILQGVQPDDILLALAVMPLASSADGFSYEDMSGASSPGGKLGAGGLIDGLMEMPVASGQTK